MRPPVKRFVPVWALQFVVGVFVVLFAVGLAVALLGPVMRGPTAFFDELGKTISRIAPQPQADPRPDHRPCHELGPPGLAALEGLAVAPVVRTDREEADDDHPECDTRHESDREEHHRVSSFLRPEATRLAGA